MTDPTTPPEPPEGPQVTPVQLMVYGKPTPAAVLTAILNLVYEAMESDGWTHNAITDAIHAQVEANARTHQEPTNG